MSNAILNDGDVITFVDGASTDGTVFARGSKKANGEYVIREIDGVLYATRSIADEFHAPEPTGKVVLMSTRRASMDEPDVMNNELAAQIYTAEELKIAMYKNRNGNGHGEKSRLMIMKNGNEINSMILQHPGYAYTKNEEDGTLSGSIDLYFYSAMGTGKEYTVPDIKSYPVGTADIFRSDSVRTNEQAAGDDEGDSDEDSEKADSEDSEDDE